MASPLPITGTLPETWNVHLPVFEGPLDLLLNLIRLNKVEITDIPVAIICDQFHRYLELMEELNLDIAGDYIYMAAYLIQLKSKMLLPKPRNLAGEEIDEDPREDLVQRLLEYRRLKEAAQNLAEVDSQRRGMWPRQSDEMRRIAKAEEPEMDLGEISLFDLLRTFRTVLDRFERENPPRCASRGRPGPCASRSTGSWIASGPVGISTSSTTCAPSPAGRRPSPPFSRSWRCPD